MQAATINTFITYTVIDNEIKYQRLLFTGLKVKAKFFLTCHLRSRCGFNEVKLDTYVKQKESINSFNEIY